jgi:hypothetical protein
MIRIAICMQGNIMSDQARLNSLLLQALFAGTFLASALASGSAQATEVVIYKWVDKNGVVSYSQNKPPESEAHDISTISVPTLPPEQQRAANRTLMQLEKSADADYAARKARQKAADARVDAALRHLQEAEKRLSAGSEVVGGDRVGMVNGHSRLRDSYFNRVAQLEAGVAQARQELNDAYAARDQLQ